MNLLEAMRKGMAEDFQSLRLVSCVVDSVDEAALTCDVTPRNGVGKMLDVQLRALADENDLGFVLIPKVGSVVLVLPLNASGTVSVVVLCTEIDKLWFRNEHIDLTLNTDGEAYLANDNAAILMEADGHTTVDAPQISLGSGSYEPLVLGNTLKGLLDDQHTQLDSLCTQLDGVLTQIPLVTVTTAMGPSGVPINAAAFATYKTQIATIKAQLATIKGNYPDFLSSVSETE